MIHIHFYFAPKHSFNDLIVFQAQRWCDDGAYLLANQQVDKFQSKEGAQTALRDIEKFQEGAPPLLIAGSDVLFMEYESVLTPYLQVNTDNGCLFWKTNLVFFAVSKVDLSYMCPACENPAKV